MFIVAMISWGKAAREFDLEALANAQGVGCSVASAYAGLALLWKDTVPINFSV